MIGAGAAVDWSGIAACIAAVGAIVTAVLSFMARKPIGETRTAVDVAAQTAAEAKAAATATRDVVIDTKQAVDAARAVASDTNAKVTTSNGESIAALVEQTHAVVADAAGDTPAGGTPAAAP